MHINRRQMLSFTAAGFGASPLSGALAQLGPRRIAMIGKSVSNSYFNACSTGAAEAARSALSVEVVYSAPFNAIAAEQIALIDGLQALSTQGIMVAPVDPVALAPACQRAVERGIRVITFDTPLAADARILHVAPSAPTVMAAKQVELMATALTGAGEVAILSSDANAPAPAAMIAFMREEWLKPAYKDMPLISVVYGGDDAARCRSEVQALVAAYPMLRGIIAPSTVACAVASRTILEMGLQGKVYVTGLGVPSEMKDPVLQGVCASFALWNPVDYGHAVAQVMINLFNGGEALPGRQLSMGRLGVGTVNDELQVAMGEPFVFDKSNVEMFAGVF